MTEEIINLRDYFIHHYDDWGRLYCVEYKGSPLELENSIQRLKQENEELKKYIIALENDNDWLTALFKGATLQKYEAYQTALEEIREIVSGCYEVLEPQAKKDIEKLINEVLQ